MRISELWFPVLLFSPSLLALGCSFLNDQQISLSPSHGKVSETPQFKPLGQLSALLETDFTALKHPAFPRHEVRVKKTKFCDGTVNSYTGYIDIGSHHLFFYFFESRRNPNQDDVILCTNGGPGCSSALGLFMELGKTKASVLFSTLPEGLTPYQGPAGSSMTTEQSSTPNHGTLTPIYFSSTSQLELDFLTLIMEDMWEHRRKRLKTLPRSSTFFFEHFAQFKGRPFHMAGESYAGRYLPVYASHLYDYDRKLKERDSLTRVNLSSIMIGNGMPDYVLMMPTYYEMACTRATVVSPVLDIAACVRMKQEMPRCAKILQEGCVDTFDKLHCQTAVAFCESGMMVPVLSSGVNPYDLSTPCEGGLDDALCYPLSRHIPACLNKTETRKELGAGLDIDIFNTMCSDEVMIDFLDNMGRYKPTRHYVSNLLDRRIRVLMYAGSTDFFANHVGTEKWALNLEWIGQEGFGKQPPRDWYVRGEKAGRTRSYGGLTFASIDGAGHMAPYDKPVESLELVTRWITGSPI